MNFVVERNLNESKWTFLYGALAGISRDQFHLCTLVEIMMSVECSNVKLKQMISKKVGIIYL